MAWTAEPREWSLDGNPQLAAWFESEVRLIEERKYHAEQHSEDNREQWQEKERAQLADMLGLHPFPEKTPLQVETTGTVDAADFIVEKICFQSMPGLFVTGNLYRPKTVESPLPAILYVCGHGQVKKDGISFGNKTHYQHHGAWFARNGYVCLIIDTLQLGEIEGIHHGTIRYDRLWWNSRGYTPAGVEAWNGIRAIDYLLTRSDVDGSRIGVTGRSGGGATSWWIAALDERIRCAVPVAGMTTLRDHVVNGCIEGHCDCMYVVNTQRIDYGQIAALVAPRPLLISNTDKDRIFPLDGVIEIHRQVRNSYQAFGAADNLGLQITEGPHADTQELHIHAFRWFNRFLKQDTSLIEKNATKFFQPEQLKVFPRVPGDQVRLDQINTTVDEVFVPAAMLPQAAEILTDQDGWMQRRTAELRDRCFRAWPDQDSGWRPSDAVRVEATESPDAETSGTDAKAAQRLRIHFESQTHVPLYLDAVIFGERKLSSLNDARLVVTEQPEAAVQEILAEGSRIGAGEANRNPVFVFSPRGLGPFAWAGNASKQTQILRRFQVIGTTADAMRIFDIRRAVQVIRGLCPEMQSSPEMSGAGRLHEMVLLASLFEPARSEITLETFFDDPQRWPSILNLTRTVTPQEILALLAHRSTVTIQSAGSEGAKSIAFVESLIADPVWTGQSIGRVSVGAK